MVANFPRSSTSSKRLLTDNEILMARTQGVGVLPQELAINAGITGPMLRATRRELRYPQSGQLRHLRPLRISACRWAITAMCSIAT